ncbi:uncharacterized protein LOC121879401 isoform X2 [Homarus americanus]|uniref:uncharacterized protein LOC121879401 isoform X2 n=1 Tax=Homarus americanus TaxID=6706 RepID=UPI001C463771|nr:uncharacterized protein LOC121879401 isoform X2 [Homarus americanus]
MDSSDSPRMDTSGTSEELDTSLESSPSELADQTIRRTPQRPSPFTLRSQCADGKCPMGTGILFRSRISPSPSKQEDANYMETRSGNKYRTCTTQERTRSRRRRRSDQSRVDTTNSSVNTSHLLELSHDHTHLHDHSHDDHTHHHDHIRHHHNHSHYHDHSHHHDRSHDHIRHHHEHTTHLHDQPHGNIHTLQHLHHHHHDHNGVHALEHHHAPQSPQLLNIGEMVGRRLRTPRKKKDSSVASKENKSTTVSQALVDCSSNGRPQMGMNGGIGGLAESVKNSVISFLTPSTERSLPAIVESSESGFEEGNLTGETVTASSPFAEKFVCAREFFAEAQTRDRLTSDYFSGTDTPSKLRNSSRRLTLRKPYNQYIAYSSDEELDEWQQQPKSDYTYSESLTYRDRVTPDRKIGSPNMSRRGLRGGNINYIKSPDFTVSNMALETDSSLLNLRTRTVLRPMDALSDTSDGEEVQVEIPSTRRLRSSRSRSIDIMPKVNGSAVTRTITTNSLTTTRTLHCGLDTESDVDDGTESTVPLRATPLTARSGTPLGRAGTPINRCHSKSKMLIDTSKGGYTLAKGAIAEDLEEEERPENTVVVWTKKTWHSITRITTLITTSFIMMAARAVTPTAADSSSTSEKSSRYSFLSTINTTRRKMTRVTTEFFESTRERLRKNPILLWIPLLFILTLLALTAYWWLLQSRAKTGDTTDPTQTDGPSFLHLILTTASDLTHWVFSSISQGFIFLQESTLSLVSWLASACYTGLMSVWLTIVGMFTWLGSVVQTCLAYMLKFLYLMLEYLQYLALAILSFFSSSASYVSGLFLPIIGSNETEEEMQTVDSETRSWNIITWASSFSPMERISEAYVSLSEVIQASGNWLWTGWLWLVLTVAEALTTTASFILWLLGSTWAFIWYLVSGLWTLLTYAIVGTVGVVTSTATTVSSIVVGTLSTVTNNAKLLVLPFTQTNKSKSKETVTPKAQETVTPKAPANEQAVNFKGISVAEVASVVLNSQELKALIATVASESSNKEQLTIENVSSIVMSALQEEKVQITTTAQETNSHILSLKQQHELLLKQLDLLGAGLAKIEGTAEVDRKHLVAHRQEYEKQLVNLRNQIEQLSSQLNDLQSDHASLATEVKTCCKNTSVTLADVEKHVTILLGDILGLPGSSSNEDSEGNDGIRRSWTAGDMGAWLKSYFVAKEELETRLNTLRATMMAKNVEEGGETTRVVMETVLQKLRVEIHKQHTEFVEMSKQQVAEQVNQQVKIAATVLGQQVSEQLQHQLQTSRQQLHDSVNVAVNTALKEVVPEHVATAVSEAVAIAVPEAVAAAVPGAVVESIPGVVNVAVEGAVDTAVEKAVVAAVSVAVSDAVNVAVSNIVDEAVPKAVANSVPDAVAEALPIAVNKAVQKAVSIQVQDTVAVVVPKVVASLLPAAVNETVSLAITEALKDLKANKENELGEEGMEVVTGDFLTSVNHTHNSRSGSNIDVDFPGMTFDAGLNKSAVIRIVNEALKKYDADRTGMVDHALESAGGNIISTRCTESYQVHQAEVSILGFTVYRYFTNNPRTIIQPDRMPGQCWAFKGSQGYIVIQLAGLVNPSAFSLEHIPKSLSPSGTIDSAPREFEVWGLTSENDEGVHFGSYEYDQDGESLQTFIVKKESSEYFPLIELKINSNHGNILYTCLYRFRVHGKRL